MARRVSHLLCEHEDLRLQHPHIQLGFDGTKHWHGRLGRSSGLLSRNASTVGELQTQRETLSLKWRVIGQDI